MGRLTALVLFAGCGFPTHAVPGSGNGDAPSLDAAPPGDAAIAVDAIATDAVAGDAACVRGFLDLCAQAEPSTALDITNAQSIDTDMDPRCRVLPQAGGGGVCLIYATRVTVTSSGSITATGGRPLAIASTSTLTLDGTIDVASHGTQRGPAIDSAACSFATTPEDDLGGGGGAAGGTFTLPGGDGGTGDNNAGDGDGRANPGTHGPPVAITVLRGGCRGQTGGDQGGGPGGGHGGSGGHSGGALYLFARQSLQIQGKVRATGAGGSGGDKMSGGGGGGTGGLVVIESPSIRISGQVSANGGGGGQGGGLIANRTVGVPGNPGSDGAVGTTAAAGGSGAANNDPGFGAGGAGGALGAAIAGTTANFGGGGGGGAAGAIKLLGSVDASGGTISPASTP